MIKIICFGKIKENYLALAIEDYYKRINKYYHLEIIELKDDNNILNEEEELLKKINNKDYLIALDIQGMALTSVEFAKKISDTLVMNSDITFIIGGSNGLTDKVLKMVNYRLSFSKLTFPHGLFRLILLEQIYRCYKINNNERYHK